MVIAILLFFVITVPFAFERPSGGRSAERQGQTAGMIRTYCLDKDRSFLEAPQIHYGNNSFNLEFTAFEWFQGGLARLVDGPECDSVEVIAKNFSILMSGLGILAVALIASLLWGNLAGIIAAFILATDDLWIRYATYTMVENRVITCALFAMFFSLKRNAIPAFLLWTLTLVQKPQIFSFIASMWGVIELTWLAQSKKSFKTYLTQKKILHTLYALGGSFVIGILYFIWSTNLNKASDLPWVMWTGPRVTKWYFGDWMERFELIYYKDLLLDWLKRTGLNIAIPVTLIFVARSKWKKVLLDLSIIALPYLIARFAYSFIFLNTFKAHEYSALPLNVGRTLMIAGVISYALHLKFDLHVPRKKFRAYLFAGVRVAMILILVALPMGKGLKKHLEFAQASQDKNSNIYLKEWNVQIFPEKNSFVVMAVPGSGRDLLHLYFTKQRGFVWCNRNPKFAPRKYWEEEGVKYVAWATKQNPKTGEITWKVRTIEEELRYARRRGWSSDKKDVWESKSMSEWAAYASSNEKDPCRTPDLFDPRKW